MTNHPNRKRRPTEERPMTRDDTTPEAWADSFGLDATFEYLEPLGKWGVFWNDGDSLTTGAAPTLKGEGTTKWDALRDSGTPMPEECCVLCGKPVAPWETQAGARGECTECGAH